MADSSLPLDRLGVLFGLTIAFLSQTLPTALKGSLREALAGYALASPAFEQAAGVNVQALMLRKVSDIRDERDLRVALSQTHVNPLKWLGMGFLGLLTLLSIAVVHIERPRAALVATLLFALAAAPTAAIVLIQGNPFQHPTDVTSDPIKTAVSGL